MHRLSILAASAALVATMSACGSSTGDARDSSAPKVPFTLTDAGCEPQHLELPAGPTTFEAKNDGASAVTEMELMQNGRVVGEVENLAPGLSGSFRVTLSPGTYETLCPNGTAAEKGDVVVTGGSSSTTTAALDAVRPPVVRS